MKQRAIDFRKVQWAEYWYVNQFGEGSRTKIRTPSVHCIPIAEPHSLAMAHYEYPGETVLARAQRLRLLDVWTPKCSFIINANKSLHFTGEAAIKMWKRYNKHIYGK